VPAESATVHGYAGILDQGLYGATTEDILEVPSGFYLRTGLEELVSPLRLPSTGPPLPR